MFEQCPIGKIWHLGRFRIIFVAIYCPLATVKTFFACAKVNKLLDIPLVRLLRTHFPRTSRISFSEGRATIFTRFQIFLKDGQKAFRVLRKKRKNETKCLHNFYSTLIFTFINMYKIFVSVVPCCCHSARSDLHNICFSFKIHSRRIFCGTKYNNRATINMLIRTFQLIFLLLIKILSVIHKSCFLVHDLISLRVAGLKVTLLWGGEFNERIWKSFLNFPPLRHCFWVKAGSPWKLDWQKFIKMCLGCLNPTFWLGFVQKWCLEGRSLRICDIDYRLSLEMRVKLKGEESKIPIFLRLHLWIKTWDKIDQRWLW